MDKKEVLEKVVEIFKLRKDFFERNPVLTENMSILRLIA